MSQPVLVETSEGITTLSLNRPHKLNALTGEMYALLEAACRAAAADPSVRAVLIRGEGESFTAGNDLADFARWQADGGSLDEVPVLKLIRYLLDFEKPLVAAVRGAAVGFGTTLLLHCDAVFAAPSARFALPFTRLGLVPEFGSSLLLPALAGRVRASHWLLSGASFDAQEAQGLGIVSALTAEAELEETARAHCRLLAQLPASAVRATKALVNPPDQRARRRQAVEDEVSAFAAGLASPEHREAVQAFMEKRKPDFGRFE